jgi:uncharacterized protein (DUF433 family)
MSATSGTAFTPQEAAFLAEVPPSRVEKTIGEKIVVVLRGAALPGAARPRRRLLGPDAVYYLAILRHIGLPLGEAKKREIYAWVRRTGAENLRAATFRLSPALTVTTEGFMADVIDRVGWYARARDAFIARDPGIKGGTPVIRGTRITVYAVAGRLDHGDTIEDLIEDNPDVPREAFQAAVAYARANPLVGRPGDKPWRDAA